MLLLYYIFLQTVIVLYFSRARTWLMASQREDLYDLDANSLYQSFRLCSMHFEPKMFTNSTCKRLKFNAVPTIFKSLENCSAVFPISHDHTYYSLGPISMSVPDEIPPKRIKVLQNIIIAPGRCVFILLIM